MGRISAHDISSPIHGRCVTHLVLTMHPSTSGSRSRCTPSALASGERCPLDDLHSVSHIHRRRVGRGRGRQPCECRRVEKRGGRGGGAAARGRPQRCAETQRHHDVRGDFVDLINEHNAVLLRIAARAKTPTPTAQRDVACQSLQQLDDRSHQPTCTTYTHNTDALDSLLHDVDARQAALQLRFFQHRQRLRGGGGGHPSAKRQ